MNTAQERWTLPQIMKTITRELITKCNHKYGVKCEKWEEIIMKTILMEDQMKMLEAIMRGCAGKSEYLVLSQDGCFINMLGCSMMLFVCKLASCLSLLIEEQSSLYQTNQIITENYCSESNKCCNVTMKTLPTLCFSCCPTFVKWYRGRLEVALQ